MMSFKYLQIGNIDLVMRGEERLRDRYFMRVWEIDGRIGMLRWNGGIGESFLLFRFWKNEVFEWIFVIKINLES